MPAENCILVSWKEQQEIFLHNLAIVCKKPDPEAVHDLRVAVKKLRSYLLLQENITGTAWKSSFTPVDIFFKTLGKYRDVEISQLLLKKQSPKGAHMEQIKEYLEAQLVFTRRWVKNAACDFKKETIKNLHRLLHPLTFFTDEEIFFLIRQYGMEILNQTASRSHHFPEEAHEIRKQLKDLYYWLRMIPAAMQPGMIQRKKLEQLLDELGSWQDLFIFRKKLTRFRKEFLSPAYQPYEQVKKMERKIILRQEMLLTRAKKNFLFLLENFYFT